MQQTQQLVELVQHRLDSFLSQKSSELTKLGPDASQLLDAAKSFLAGGKRFRAQALSLGFQAVKPLYFAQPLSDDAGRVVSAAAALEVFHAAALIHDDVIDRSATRRGNPTVHSAFANSHRAQSWRGSARHYGISVAILLGDLLQSWADELMQEAINYTPAAAGRRVREFFNRMRTEVACGQFFDVLEEQYPQFSDTAEQFERATRVLLYKSAKYSVEEPLLIGAALAGASTELEKTLSAYGVPVGVAFQLRDDILGVFGDAEISGKPSGDDLIEGKRTVLVTLARAEISGTVRNIFDELFGDATIDAQQLAMLQRTIVETGAVAKVEKMINQNIEVAKRHAKSPEIAAGAVEPLIALADKMAYRQR